MSVFSKIGLIGLALFFSAPAYAIDSDALIEGAKLCTAHLPRYERENAIPTHLLSAIASTESGRYHEGLKLKLPWPWTINAAGKGYLFDTKEEAIAAVHKFRAHGVQSIDVGCMQVNLYQHPKAFSSLDKAFDPENNIAYAAGFLRGLYDDSGTWKKAAADYHSKSPRLGGQYVDTVYDSWFTIIERLRAARLHQQDNTEVAMNDAKIAANLSPSAGGAHAASMKTTPLPEQEGKKVASYTPPRMNSIKVSSTDSRAVEAFASHKEHGVLVVKPEMVTADSTPVAAADSKVIAISDRQPASTASAQPRKSGPNFIFND